MIKKQLAFIFSLMIVSICLNAQVEERVETENRAPEKKTFGQRLVFGGDIGLSFGTITYIKLAPVIGYRITDRLTAGIGPIYIYEKYKDANFETSTFGGKTTLSYALFRGIESGGSLSFGSIILHAENEVINVEPLYFDPINQYFYFNDRLWIDNLLVGGGLSQPIAGRFSASIFILWDITQNKHSPYTNPIFKFGFNF